MNSHHVQISKNPMKILGLEVNKSLFGACFLKPFVGTIFENRREHNFSAF